MKAFVSALNQAHIQNSSDYYLGTTIKAAATCFRLTVQASSYKRPKHKKIIKHSTSIIYYLMTFREPY